MCKRENKIGGVVMVTLLNQEVQESKKRDEFNDYIKKQQSKTTFNGIEVAAFSWYKKVLGIE